MALIADIHEEEITNGTGEIPAGFLFASFKNIGSVNCRVNNFIIEPGDAKTYPFIGKAYPAVSYGVSSSTTLAVMYIC